jgi:AraC-like DNA-binding protein
MDAVPGSPWSRLCLAEPPRIHALGIGTHGPGTPRWRLPGLWCLHAYPYHAGFALDGVELPIRPGRVGVSPAGAEMQYRFPRPSTHAYVHFRPAAGAPQWEIAAMQDAGAEFAEIDAALREAIAWHAAEPRRAEARLWDILWRIARRADAAGHPLVAQARRHIELHLGRPLAVAAVARAVGCSHNHLTRLFRAELRCGVAQWIRARRAHRARHLLTGTSMAIADIAAEVGIPDPHHFNKVVRRELGQAPRAVRGRG